MIYTEDRIQQEATKLGTTMASSTLDRLKRIIEPDKVVDGQINEEYYNLVILPFLKNKAENPRYTTRDFYNAFYPKGNKKESKYSKTLSGGIALNDLKAEMAALNVIIENQQESIEDLRDILVKLEMLAEETAERAMVNSASYTLLSRQIDALNASMHPSVLTQTVTEPINAQLRQLHNIQSNLDALESDLEVIRDEVRRAGFSGPDVCESVRRLVDSFLAYKRMLVKE